VTPLTIDAGTSATRRIEVNQQFCLMARAIQYALAYPKPTPGKRTDLIQDERGEQPSWRDLSQARVIINEAPDLIEQDQ